MCHGHLAGTKRILAKLIETACVQRAESTPPVFSICGVFSPAREASSRYLFELVADKVADDRGGAVLDAVDGVGAVAVGDVDGGYARRVRPSFRRLLPRVVRRSSGWCSLRRCTAGRRWRCTEMVASDRVASSFSGGVFVDGHRPCVLRACVAHQDLRWTRSAPDGGAPSRSAANISRAVPSCLRRGRGSRSDA